MSESRQNLQIAFGNLLDDSYHYKGIPLQKDRLDDLAYDLTHIDGVPTPQIAGWCEGANEMNLYELADKTRLRLAHKPFQYSPREWMAVAIAKDLKVDEPADFFHYGKEREGFRPGFIAMKVAGVQLRLIHHPHHIFSAIKDRREGTKALLDTINPNEPTVIMGDFNVVPFQYARVLLPEAGLSEVHAEQRPLYPNKAFKNKTFPGFIRLSLDGIYVSRHITLSNTAAMATAHSDHPLLTTGISFPIKTNEEYETFGSAEYIFN